jgi:hypothetical protein
VPRTNGKAYDFLSGLSAKKKGLDLNGRIIAPESRRAAVHIDIHSGRPARP